LEALRRVRDALGHDDAGGPGVFHFDRRHLGEVLRLSELYARLEAIPEVVHSLVLDFRPESAPKEPRLLDRIQIPSDGVATGGDPLDPSVGVLIVDGHGGLA
jgi:hypothetical protein